MEKEKFFLNTSTPPPLTCGSLSLPPPNWEASSGMEPQLAELNCGSEQFLNLNWVNFVNQSSPFEQAVSSTVASIRTMPRTVAGSGGASYIGVNLPLVGNSMVPHHPNLAPFTADPAFAERAAKFSCFGNENCGGPMRQFPFPEIELAQGPLLGIKQHMLLRVSSSQSLNTGSNIALQDGLAGEIRTATASSLASERGKNCGLSRSSTPDDAEFGNARCETSVTDLSSKGPSEANAKKRKAVPRVKAKEPSSPPGKDAKLQEAEDNDLNTKRCKTTEVDETGKDVVKGKTEQNGSPNSGSGGKNQTKDRSNPSEPPKQDYIHVRARRGQATDSHSLAERVRREKISERMKFLQDLVPGCNKVTGKAVMLDEIINYVQSLQRQVEFLSMKLATVNPRLDINVETLLSKDILQSHGSLPQSVYPLDSSASVFSYGNEPQQGSMPTVVSNGLETVNPLDGTLHQTLGMQLPSIDGHRDAASQNANFWEDGLQNVLHMGFGQNAEISFPSQTFQGSLPTTANMKIEL